jgi:SnoaL-like domain
MLQQNRVFIFLGWAMLLTITSCHSDHSRSEIELSMKQYDHYIKNTDADSIAQMFTPDGGLGNIAHGRDSIRKFLSSFKNISVLATESTTGSIVLNSDSATQTGTYWQLDLINAKDTVKVKGIFTARWKWTKESGWRLKKWRQPLLINHRPCILPGLLS